MSYMQSILSLVATSSVGESLSCPDVQFWHTLPVTHRYQVVGRAYEHQSLYYTRLAP